MKPSPDAALGLALLACGAAACERRGTHEGGSAPAATGAGGSGGRPGATPATGEERLVCSIAAQDSPQVGYGRAFVLAAIVRCGGPQAPGRGTDGPDVPGEPGGRIAWRQIAGAPLREVRVSEDGRRFEARTADLASLLGTSLPWGPIPVSPRTRGSARIEATWRDDRGLEARREIEIAAAAPLPGLPNVPVATRLFLGGAGWRVLARPASSTAELEAAAPATAFLPDVAGDWRLADEKGRRLHLRAARYDSVPLDCGRSGCHADIAAAAATSPMTSILARGLARNGAVGPSGVIGGRPGRLSNPAYPGCAVGCHTTGQAGIADGGFAHVAEELRLPITSLGAAQGRAPGHARDWDRLPRPLRRLGGVGCLACHGPGAVPAADARWTVLRAGACAVCHDAPPRYGHAQAYASTRMATADRDPRTRALTAAEPCARCHTTWGFLARTRPPAHAEGLGLGCATCHAVHGSKSQAEAVPVSRAAPAPAEAAAMPPPAPRALLRDAAVPAWLGSMLPAARARSGVCMGCHAPDPEAPVPFASAAALWFGRGGLDPATGKPMHGPTPHALVDGGCVGCHRGGPPGLERGTGHGFAAVQGACGGCHTRPPVASDVRARAQRLWRDLTVDAEARVAARPVAAPSVPHAILAPPRAGVGRPDRRDARGRAIWNLRLVLEDPAADAHNQAYARMLVDSAERVLAARAPAGEFQP